MNTRKTSTSFTTRSIQWREKRPFCTNRWSRMRIHEARYMFHHQHFLQSMDLERMGICMSNNWWQHFTNCINAAKDFGVNKEKVEKWEQNIIQLKPPVQIGESRQIKEWFPETTLGSIYSVSIFWILLALTCKYGSIQRKYHLLTEQTRAQGGE